MDTTGTRHVAEIETEMCDCYDVQNEDGSCPVEEECYYMFDTEAFYTIQDEINVIASNDLTNSLGTPITVNYPSYVDAPFEHRSCTPLSRVVEQADSNTCGSGSSAGLRVILSIDKSYVKYVLHSTEKLTLVDECAILLSEDSSTDLTFKKAKETDEYIMLLSNNSSTLYLRALNVNTKSFATITQKVWQLHQYRN